MKPAKWIVWEPFLLAVMVVAGIVIGMRLDDQLPPSKLLTRTKDKTRTLSPVTDAIKYIESRYIADLDVQNVNDTLIQVLVDQLDPHSYYLSGWHYRSFKHQMAGSYNGIGINYESLDDSLIVLYAFEGGPAREAGLQTGDIILAIDTIQISGSNLSPNEIYQVWQSTGEELSLQIKRAGVETFKIQMHKADIHIPPVPAAFMIDTTVGFIKISSFTDKTYREFMKELDSLVQLGCKDLIIDVRDNPGGSFESVVDILNQLIPEKDKLMVYMEGKNVKRTEFRTKGNAYFNFNHISILINQSSVSGSEILAGVLQDLEKGKVIGRRSYGKALVQETFPLTDTTALNLTIGKYFLPSGRFIQRPFTDRKSYEMEWNSRFTSGEFFFRDSMPKGPSDGSFTSVSGQQLPSGVGITPDIFVPADSLYFSSNWKVLKEIVWRFAVKQYNKFFQSIPDDLTGIKKYRERESYTDMLIEFLESQSYSDLDFVEEHRTQIDTYLWSEWIKYKLGKNDYYRFTTETDPDIEAALHYIRESNPAEEYTEHL